MSMSKDFKILDEMRKERHANWKQWNLLFFAESDLQYRSVNNSECLLFRSDTKSSDFYPSTGRWKDNKTGKMHRGGANAFSKWWKK